MTESLFDLGHAPQAAAKDTDGSVVVATTKRLLRIIPASKKTVVILDKAFWGEPFWGELYPNSMVIIPSGTIFVGLRHGIAKIEKNGKFYKVLWALPDKKFADDKSNNGFKKIEVVGVILGLFVNSRTGYYL